MPKENHTLINGLSPVTKESGGTVVGFPDVCKAPGPSGPMPVPVPNIAKSEDLADGSNSVTIGGAPVALSTSKLARSTGNEAPP
ncbi:PAAR-like domain-containing protein [Pyxidicoccus caerfyrddinensis]|uniref:PAAR-like domain-containing protein n=1 Tax=Pyxidicoccus caerfyrddinensis TaxID=2709663 RepID=UPI0013DC214C|nr:PAAR-like domain-containing protein [Pyxidicoccus caerfyrddinensis]